MNRNPARTLTALGLVLVMLGCEPSTEPSDDANVVPRPDNLEEDRDFASRPTLQHPIYACAESVVVSNFIPGARIDVFVDGDPTPIGTMASWLSEGDNVDVSISFTEDQVVTATQSYDGARSDPSDEVVVSSHTEDYPDGLPRPRLDPPPVHECGRALGIMDVVPGATARVFAENTDPANPGDLLPPAQVGSLSDFPYTFISPAFELDAKIWAEQQLCTDVSDPSDELFVVAAPASIPKPSVDDVHENTNIVVVRDTVNGATLEVRRQPADVSAGGQPTPGGAPQQVFISPEASPPDSYTATQELCARSMPSDPVPVIPCADMPPAKIVAPAPGDTQVILTDWIPGARILVFADGVEIGDGGPPAVNLSRPIAQGETVVVLQRLLDCDSALVYSVDAECTNAGGDGRACSGDWPSFRHDGLRQANQRQSSLLADPDEVKRLEVAWTFDRPGFSASPVVFNGMVYIGSSNGRLYALRESDGALQWTFPPDTDPALSSDFTCNPSSRGLAASVAIASIRRDEGPQERNVVILGAPDRGRPGETLGAGIGSGRLFALDAATGVEVWRSPEIAVLDGTQSAWPFCAVGHASFDAVICDQALNELHEQIGYSSPLVYDGKVYVGIANHCDNPIQKGRIVAVDLATGTPVAGFDFRAADDPVTANDRGGGVWSSVAGGFGEGVYTTTGNTKTYTGAPEAATNHGLSLLRLDAATGAVVWKHQPVPFDLDGDPDWASGPTLMSATCGELVVSTMKDGWTYAVEAGDGTPGAPGVRWQFPPTGFPFTAGDGTAHGDTRYLMPGAAWRNVFFTMTGGEMVDLNVDWGFTRIHALEGCAGRGGRVRWMADIPGTTLNQDYQLGPPSVTHGIVFVGTAQGRLVAIADPSVYATAGSRCTRDGVALADCVAMGYQIVPVPRILYDEDLGGGGVRGEVVLANGRVYYGTTSGRLYALEPR